MAAPPVTADFESISIDLSIRAKHVLANLGANDVPALLRLTHDDLIQAWSCGKKTIAEIEALQSLLRPQNEREVIEVSSDVFALRACSMSGRTRESEGEGESLVQRHDTYGEGPA